MIVVPDNETPQTHQRVLSRADNHRGCPRALHSNPSFFISEMTPAHDTVAPPRRVTPIRLIHRSDHGPGGNSHESSNSTMSANHVHLIFLYVNITSSICAAIPGDEPAVIGLTLMTTASVSVKVK